MLRLDTSRMKLVIDSQPAEPPHPAPATFKEFCAHVMGVLADQGRSIVACKLDGLPVTTLDLAESQYPAAQVCEVETVPVEVALQTSLSLQFQLVRQIEGDCETLVTDILLAEPMEVVDKWKFICAQIQIMIACVPQLCTVLTEAQINELIDVQLADFNSIMEDCGNAFNAADVVSVSDILELRLQPWLANFRELLQSLLARLNQQGGDPAE